MILFTKTDECIYIRNGLLLRVLMQVQYSDTWDSWHDKPQAKFQLWTWLSSSLTAAINLDVNITEKEIISSDHNEAVNSSAYVILTIWKHCRVKKNLLQQSDHSNKTTLRLGNVTTSIFRRWKRRKYSLLMLVQTFSVQLLGSKYCTIIDNQQSIGSPSAHTILKVAILWPTIIGNWAGR